MVFLLPLGYACAFGAVYMAGILTHIPLAIVDQDHSKLSREISTSFSHSSHFKIINTVDTYAKLEAAMQTGQVRAGIVIPENFAQKVQEHRQTQVLTVYDGSNMIWAYNIKKYTSEIITAFNAEHVAAYLTGLNFSQQEIKAVLDTVSCHIETWNNPTYSYATFIVMGLFIMILHQVSLLGISLTITREKEQNSWVQYLCSAIPRWKIFVGKSLPYFIITFFHYALLVVVVSAWYGVKVEGSLNLIIILGLLFDVIITSIGFYISAQAPNSLQSTRYLMLLSVPFFVISGYSWPKTHIPAWINSLAHLLPYTWMSEAFRLVTVKNLDRAYITNNLRALLIMACLSVLLALFIPRRRKPDAGQDLSVNGGLSYPSRGRH